MLKNNGKVVAAVILLNLFITQFMSGCSGPQEASSKQHDKILRLATTTSTLHSGLLDVLLAVFESKYDVEVEVIAKGTGAALELASQGGADVVLAHARSAEEKFITDGYGINRQDVMYNDFVILGPPGDPANLKGEKDVLLVLSTIAKQKQTFVTRGDNSGTHIKEKDLWELADIVPQGDWYIISQEGMLGTLELASEKKAYLLTDRSTYLFNKESLDLIMISEGDKQLYNPYGVIAVNPAKVDNVNFKAAMRFVEFITSPEGQELIKGYGAIRYGRPLFTPSATK